MEELLPIASSAPDTGAKPMAQASIDQTARAAWALWIYGAVIALVTLGFAWRYSLAANYTRLTDIGKLSHYAWPEFAGFVGGGALWFGCYLLALRVSRRLPAARAMPAVFGCAAFMALGMYWMYPVSAID